MAQTRKKKIGCAAIAVMMGLTTLYSMPITTSAVEETVTKYEFEDGTNVSCEEFTDGWTDESALGETFDVTNPSGTGFVYLKGNQTSLSVTVTVEEAGLYELNFCYCQPFGDPKKVQYLYVNGISQGDISFAYNLGWEETTGTMVHLDAGDNEITLGSYWGWTLFDYLTVQKADANITALNPTTTLSNPNASETTQRLYAYLNDIYGSHILAGQQEYCGSHNYNYAESELTDNEAEFTYLMDTTGKQCAVRGIDFLNYCTTSLWDDHAAERAIEWTNDVGGIATITWHWRVPLDMETYDPTLAQQSANFYYLSDGYPDGTTFSVSKAVQEGTQEHEIILKDIELIASKLQMLEDADVSVLWRPLHEAEGGWFWWGAEGPEACVALYRLLYDQLTNVYGLDNLIWEWTCYSYDTSAAWYPGDDVVDILGYDKYNVKDGVANLSAISSVFYTIIAQNNGQKLVAMSENDTIPSLDNLLNENAGWLYFCPWYMNYLTAEYNNPVDNLVEIYNSDYCITLDELPDLKTYPLGTEGTTTTAATEETNTTTTTTTAGMAVTLYGDVNVDEYVTVSDLILLARYVAEDAEASISAQGFANADCSKDSVVNVTDISLIAGILVKSVTIS